MKDIGTRVIAVALAALAATCAWADEVPTDKIVQHTSPVVGVMLCILPLVGAACLYLAMRRRRK
ncbi:MAG: hypothetical protein IKO72_04860 [Kiritimatiellae bacterium]|nr:hypothetical protein [Kiritimatiellia bacterium]